MSPARTCGRSGARLALAAAALLWASAAAGQSCKVSAANMVFTGYTPFGPGASATATLTYSCDPGVTQAGIGISQPRVLRSGGNQLQFDIYTAPDLSTVWPDVPPWPVPPVASGTVTVYGFLPPQDAAAGNYGANLFVTLTSQPGGRTSSTPMRVSANVPNTCTIGAGSVAFGGYDPVVANLTTPLDAQGTFQVSCTRGTAYAVGLGAGSFAAGTTRQMANGAQRLAYELYADAGRTTVWNTTTTVTGTAPSVSPITLTVYGRIPAGQAVGGGPYADTVQSTINF